MTPTERLVIAAVVAAGCAGGFAAGRALFRPIPSTTQPIRFNHQIHAGELEIPCELCHEHYATSEHSGLPALSTCLDCHEEAVTDSPEEQKIRDHAETTRGDVFVKLFRLPDHVFYSHRRHAELGELPCETCHGEIAATSAPPERPLVRVSMEFCTDCHEDAGVRSECTTCHR